MKILLADDSKTNLAVTTSALQGLGDDYLTKPFSEVTLAAKIRAMQRIANMRQKLFETTQTLHLMSSTDPLTGVYNRTQFEKV